MLINREILKEKKPQVPGYGRDWSESSRNIFIEK